MGKTIGISDLVFYIIVVISFQTPPKKSVPEGKLISLLLTRLKVYPLKRISRENTREGEASAAPVTQMPIIVAIAKVPPLFLNNP